MSQSDFFNWMPNLTWFIFFFVLFYYLISSGLLPFVFESRQTKKLLKSLWRKISLSSYQFDRLSNFLEYISCVILAKKLRIESRLSVAYLKSMTSLKKGRRRLKIRFKSVLKKLKEKKKK